MRLNPSLAEESLRASFDEDLSVDAIFEDEACWGSDPMQLLMIKQEQERTELQVYLYDCMH